jgi:hypothetical protein
MRQPEKNLTTVAEFKFWRGSRQLLLSLFLVPAVHRKKKSTTVDLRPFTSIRRGLCTAGCTVSTANYAHKFKQRPAGCWEFVFNPLQREACVLGGVGGRSADRRLAQFKAFIKLWIVQKEVVSSLSADSVQEGQRLNHSSGG